MGPRCRGACAPALLCMLLAYAGGCRDNSAGPVAQPGSTVQGLFFAQGDSLTFDAWTIDSLDYVVESSHAALTWSVAGVNGVFAGADNVTAIKESFAAGSPSATTDTLRFRFLPSGDIEQYGFIAQVVRRREGISLPAAWDRIAAFSLPTNATWVVGAVDSAGNDTMRGTVLGDQGYFIALLNGVRTVFHAYGVGLSSQDIQYTIAVSGTPPAVLLIREEGTYRARGLLRVLSAIAVR